MDEDYFKGKLLALEQEVKEALRLANEASAVVTLDQTLVGRLSRMDAIQQQEMALAGKRRQELMLQQISQALARLEKGDFGFCLSCGEEIAFKRLDLNPVVTTCIACASG